MSFWLSISEIYATEKLNVYKNTCWQPASQDVVTNLILQHSLYWVVDGQYRHCANGNRGLVENKEMSMNTCIKSARFCSDNFYVCKLHLKSVMYHPHLSPAERCEPVSASKDFSCFLREINIYYKTSKMRGLSVHLNSFAEKFCSFRLKKILNQILDDAWLWWKYGIKSILSPLPTFLTTSLVFCQHSKNWLERVYGSGH